MRLLMSYAMRFFVLFFLSSCTTLQVSEDVQSGRRALMAGQPKAALTHFEAAGQSDPDYITDFTLLEIGIWTYIGRAYYEIGEKEKALESLRRAKDSSSDDYFARIYLGLVMSQNGGRREGIAELRAGLKGLRIWLETLPDQSPRDGQYWDPAGLLMRAIVDTQGLLREDSINLARVDENVRWLGDNFEDEIEEVKEDKFPGGDECNQMWV